MTRLISQPVSQATGPVAEIFANIKAAIGVVPNAYADIGTNSPTVLSTLLAMDATLAKGSLSKKEVETVKLALSEDTGCDYCLAAHTMIGKSAGLNKEQILAARHGTASGDARLDALALFARTVHGTKGTLPVETVDAVKAAGYTDTQIVETLLAISAILFTNYFNRVNDTVLDFPKAD